MALKIIFAGTPEFSTLPLQALQQHADYDICAVYTQPDRPAGRGRKVVFSPVKQLAQQYDIPCYQPQSLRDAEVITELQALQADLMVVVAYGLILPQQVLDAPRLGCLNIHASLLPRWRGAAPIQRAILAGDEETGVTIMQMDAGLDSGNIIAIKRCDINDDDTGSRVHDRLALMGSELLLDVLSRYASGTVASTVQDEAQVCYAEKIHKEEAKIDWHKSAVELARAIRAFNAWPVCFSNYAGKTIRLWQAQVSEQHSDKQPGTIYGIDNGYLHVATGDGSLLIEELQVQGKKRMSATDFINGHQELRAGDQVFSARTLGF